MQYRKFGKLGFEVSTLGFGSMRLPIVDGDESRIDEPEAIRMIRHAIDRGVNYVDTAYPYHRGNSEPLVGKALKDGYRQRVKLATKMPTWLTKTYEDFDKYLNEQMERLDTDHIDFYLLHSLNADNWPRLKDLKVLDFLERALKDGRIGHAAFSFHDELPVFKEIIDAYDWSFGQIHLNYVDQNYQAGVEGLKYAASKGIPVIVMEPLRGGKLTKTPPPEIESTWDESPVKRTPAEWAFQWAANFPEVAVILSGMSTMEQVEDNLRIFDAVKPNALSPKELALIDRVKDLYLQKVRVRCTGCEYCMPCPNEVLIPHIFEMYNDVSMYGEMPQIEKSYRRMMEGKKDASACAECAKCETACPQNLPIREHLKAAHAMLAKG